MTQDISRDSLFERTLTFPDMDAKRRFARLVGVDDAKIRLARLLAALINPQGLRDWAKRHHAGARTLVEFVERRPPLVVLAGDVGTGKTELAETVGDAVARQEGIDVQLFPLSLAARGSGRVGEMTKLVAAAFEETIQVAGRMSRGEDKAAGAVILLVDEADALTQSRETEQMHHEDRAGVNAFIRGVDRLAERRLPAAVILCTNRLGAIDPAVQRRAAEIFRFERPNAAQRRFVLDASLAEIGFKPDQIDRIVACTGERDGQPGFTYSDLTQRLIPAIVLDAYPADPVTFERAFQVLERLHPTPPFGANSRERTP